MMTHAQNLPDPLKRPGIPALISQTIARTPSLTDYLEPLIQLVYPHYLVGKIATKVVNLRNEDEHVYSIVLRPGRAFRSFVPGQYVELSVERNGRRFSRYFSISSGLPQWHHEGTLELSIRVQEGGQITSWLRQTLKAGAVVHISQAQGDFVLPNVQSPLLMLAGGSGITPFRSMLASLQHPEQAITLLYYAQNADAHLFREELLAHQAQYPQVKVVLIDSEHEGFFGSAHLQQHCPDFAARDIYICGPAPMILHSRKLLQELNVPDAQIHFEFFGPTPTQLDSPSQTGITEFRRSVKQIVNPEAPQSLLVLAEDAGLKPASGCRMGVCYQCICKKQSGVVFNTKTGQYSDTGAQDIQLCISVPVGNVVLDI